MSPGREQAGQHACTLTGPPQRGHRIAPSIGVDQSFQGLDQLGVMMDQRLSSGPRMPDSLNGEGALRKALDGRIDGRARKTSNTGDDGNTSSSQSLAIEGCNQVLLSLIDVRKQQGVLPLKFFGFAHSRIIPYPPSCVTINFLRALTGPPMVETIDKHGLKTKFLSKHKRNAEAFLDWIAKREITSEVAQGYKSRLEKYGDRLFTFLDYDGVPWNNNNAENALKLVASRRRLFGTSVSEAGLKDYLVFLSIYQTLRRKGISLLRFLLSGETDLEKFVASYRRR